MLLSSRLIAIAIALAIAAVAKRTSAAQVAISNLSGLHPISNIDGALVPIGTGFVQVGTILLSDAEVIAIASDRASLVAAFEEFGSSHPFGAGGSGGFFSTNISSPISAGDPLVGQNIYIVAGDGSGIANSNGIWIFKSTAAFDDDDAGTFSASINLDSDLISGTGVVLVGTPADTFVPLAGDSFAGSEMVAFIPEPCVAPLVGLSALLLFGRERRQR